MFLFIAVLTFAIQTLMVQFGGKAVRSVPLSLFQNLICLAIGSFSLIWAVFIKLVLPPSLFKRLALKEEPMTYEEI